MPSAITLSQAILKTLEYSSRFDYPLTAQEIWYWLPSYRASKTSVADELKNLTFSGKISTLRGFYFLKGRSRDVPLRRQRRDISRQKWLLARRIGYWLAKIPTIKLVAATGSLAMNNCEKNADIDLMIVTSPNTLWPTRLLVWIFLRLLKLRRSPLTTSPRLVKDKICDNLYLDSAGLSLSFLPAFSSRRFRLAREALQVKPIIDRSGIFNLFLSANRWIQEIFPQASFPPSVPGFKEGKSPNNLFWGVLYPLNMFFYLVQLLYMKPKITTEFVSLKAAFFHPSNNPLDRKKNGPLQ